MAKNFTYLRRFSDIIDSLSAKYDISKEDIEDIIDHFFKTFNKLITDFRMPKIQITNFGTFKPTIGKVNWFLKNSFHRFKFGHIDKDKLRERIKRVWFIKQRIIKEKNGGSTWNNWKDLKKEDAEE